jgi:multidrug resistance efflux pump
MQANVPPPSLGFPRTLATSEPGSPVRPTPLPRRPKGRWFIAVLLLAAFGYGAFQVYDTFFRYRAYGVITGRVLNVSPPWEGVVQYVHVREGDTVRQGQLLVSLDNTELRHRRAQLDDELRVAQATLEAEAAKLKWQAAFHLDQSEDAQVRYLESWGELLQEQSRLDRLKNEAERVASLHSQNAVSKQELDQVLFDLRGQEQKLVKLQTALAERKKRAELSGNLLGKQVDSTWGLMGDGANQLKPSLARIEALQTERTRLDQRLAQGRVCAPTNGLVVKISRFAGERCLPSETLVALLEERSLQVVLYLPQGSSDSVKVGDVINLRVDPYPEPLTCTLTQLGERYEPAPESIRRHYALGQQLLPAYFQPRPESARWMALRVGSVVKW